MPLPFLHRSPLHQVRPADPRRTLRRSLIAVLCGFGLHGAALAAEDAASDAQATPQAQIAPEEERWNVHGQFTNVTQWHPGFSAAYSGANSLTPTRDNKETADLTLFLGLRLWKGAELYANPEIDQGFGLDNTLGMAGFPSAEAYKVGNYSPYHKLPRLFLRQVINLGGEQQAVESGPNQLGGTRSADNLTVTVGKFSVADIFDTNTYAHDPRGDYLNWSIVESGAFDYAADAWGYTHGLAVEWTQSWWTLRGGFFSLSDVPNSITIDTTLKQYQWVGEFEARHQLLGRPGKVKFLAVASRGRMGGYGDAGSLAQQTGNTPDTSLVRRLAWRPGFAINLEQELAADLGVFARASMNDGSKETFEFTDINQSVSAGLSLKGDRWGRHSDTVGVAFVVNGLSRAARQYFEAGGLGVLIGDGALNYGTERIAELYYNWAVVPHVTLGLNYQYVVHPAYNRDRGPVSILGARIHAEF